MLSRPRQTTPQSAGGAVDRQSVPPSVPTSSGPPAARLRDILDAFEGEFPRVKTALGYRLGVLLVTGAMLMLPLVYVALIGLVAYFVGWYAVHGLAIIKTTHSIWAVVFGYAGPLIAGGILFFFMIKPLFARSPKAGRSRTLEHGREPVLFAFVSRIARAVGAPAPRRIQVDCDANASASFGSGLSGLFGRDLTLTIGLPLVAELTAQQLAGVLAHELGHFAQGAAMRLSYVIRMINGWFVRVVYERDEWDETLVRWCEESGRLALIFYLACLCVWITRGILWLFMVFGHAISCFLLRQMEFDADRYEARVAGSRAFAETMRRLQILNIASHGAYSVLAACWKEGKYPDNLPALIVHMAEQIPAKDRRRVEKEIMKLNTSLFDTHPSDRDRVASVQKEPRASFTSTSRRPSCSAIFPS
jgi:Zn-dependent protease with chaperone function